MNDRLLTPPTIDGAFGRAWRYSAEDVAAIAKGNPHGTVDDWLIECSWAHPFWWNYRLILVHLRPIAGFPPPLIHLQGATHELMLAALDPRWSPSGLMDNPGPHMMRPFNFASQMVMPSDESARSRVEEAVFDIVERGILSPDTDFIRQWIARFGNNMIRKGHELTAGQTKVVIAEPGGNRQEIVFDPKPATALPNAKRRK